MSGGTIHSCHIHEHRFCRIYHWSYQHRFIPDSGSMDHCCKKRSSNSIQSHVPRQPPPLLFSTWNQHSTVLTSSS